MPLRLEFPPLSRLPLRSPSAPTQVLPRASFCLVVLLLGLFPSAVITECCFFCPYSVPDSKVPRVPTCKCAEQLCHLLHGESGSTDAPELPLDLLYRKQKASGRTIFR